MRYTLYSVQYTICINFHFLEKKKIKCSDLNQLHMNTDSKMHRSIHPTNIYSYHAYSSLDCLNNHLDLREKNTWDILSADTRDPSSTHTKEPSTSMSLQPTQKQLFLNIALRIISLFKSFAETRKFLIFSQIIFVLM